MDKVSDTLNVSDTAHSHMKPEDIIRAATYMLAVDGKIDPLELRFARALCRRLNVPEEFIQTALAQMQAGKATLALPEKPEERIRLFNFLAEAAAANGVIAPQELAALKAVAAKIGLPEQAVAAALERHLKKSAAKTPRERSASPPPLSDFKQEFSRSLSAAERQAPERFRKNDERDDGAEKRSAARNVAPRDAGLRFAPALKLVFLVSLALFGVAYCRQSALPPPAAILKPLYAEPVQKEARQKPFQVQAGKKAYTIKPLFSYELAGLVVSYHHSSGFADYYHELWGDALNLKDICVVWGNNIRSEAYRRSKFKSGPFTCYWWTRDEDFDQTAISNNHLISEKKNITKQIMRAKKGDQIYLKGFLAEYSNKEGFHRGTSTTRDDTWDGACETIYLTEFRILKSANAFWRFAYFCAKWLMLGSAGLFIFLHVRDALQTANDFTKNRTP